MPKNTATAPLTPMLPDDVMLAFNFIRAIQAGDVDAAEDFAAGDYPSVAGLLVDVAERIVTPVTALPDQVAGEPCADTFALEALGRVFIRTLRIWEQSCPSTATGIAEAIIGFTKEILTEDHEDVAVVLEQLQAVGVGQALDAHPAPTGAHPVRLTAV